MHGLCFSSKISTTLESKFPRKHDGAGRLFDFNLKPASGIRANAAGMAEWSNAPDCKSGQVSVRGFESLSLHHLKVIVRTELG